MARGAACSNSRPQPGAKTFGGLEGASNGRSGCIVRIRLWLRLPHIYHRLLSIASVSGVSTGAPAVFSLGPLFRCSLAFGLYKVMHPGYSSLLPRRAGPIWPIAVRLCVGLRLKNPVGTGLVKVNHSGHSTYSGGGGGVAGCSCRLLGALPGNCR